MLVGCENACILYLESSYLVLVRKIVLVLALVLVHVGHSFSFPFSKTITTLHCTQAATFTVKIENNTIDCHGHQSPAPTTLNENHQPQSHEHVKHR